MNVREVLANLLKRGKWGFIFLLLLFVFVIALIELVFLPAHLHFLVLATVIPMLVVVINWRARRDR